MTETKKKTEVLSSKLIIGNEIIHRGICSKIDRKELEHLKKWSKGHIAHIGRRRTHDCALQEDQEKKSE